MNETMNELRRRQLREEERARFVQLVINGDIPPRVGLTRDETIAMRRRSAAMYAKATAMDVGEIPF
jgi:hypothetical protein